MGYKILDVIFPVLIHFLVLELFSLAGVSDAALRTLLAAAVTLPLFVYWYRRERTLWGRRTGRLPWYLLVLTAAAAVPVNLVWSRAVTEIAARCSFLDAAQSDLFAGNLVVQILGPGLLAAVTEEVLFRGLVYGKLERCLSPASALVLSTLLFAFYHGDPVQILFALPMGLILALLYRYRGRLLLPIVFHAAVNLSSIFLELLRNRL